MSKSTEKLIELLENDSTIDFIKSEMNLTNRQLAYRLSLLKNSGYFLQKKYYGNGIIKVSLINSCDCLNNKYAKIYTKKDERTIKFLVISDLHYFNEKENRVAIDNAFNYCAKNGINIILICGDLIDCMVDNTIDISRQADEFLNLYPYDNSIINFCVLGNHDFLFAKNSKMDFKKLIENRRLDIVPINYLDAGICIKNDKLYLNHPIKDVSSNYGKVKNNSLNFIGHSHTSKIEGRNIYVPSLSDVKVHNEKNFGFIPQALEVNINFSESGTFSKVIIDQLIMNSSPYIISEEIIKMHYINTINNNLEINKYPVIKKINK